MILFWIISIGMLCSATFFESHAVVNYDDDPSKTTITVSYTDNTSKTYTILANSNQKYSISQQYSWTNNNSTRFNLQAYSIDNDPFIFIQRESNGNFTLELLTDSNHSIVFLAKPQFKIITSGTSKTDFLPLSPTNDRWFDLGSDVQIIVPYVLQSNQENIRQQLSGWLLDSSDINVISRQEDGYFKSPPIHMSSMHKMNLEYKTQYYIKVISNFGRALGTGWYDSGTIAYVSVLINNNALFRYVFTGWQGSVIESGNQESTGVLSDSPKIIVAKGFVDYTNVSIIGIIAIAVLVLLVIYLKRRIPKK